MTSTMTPMTDWTTIEKGTEVKVSGDNGRYIFQYHRNGEVTVFGGSANPNGVRMFRTFDADRVRVIHRRSELRKFQPSLTIPPRQRRGRR